MKCRLAAIVAADRVGYSRLTGAIDAQAVYHRSGLETSNASIPRNIGVELLE